MRKNKYSIFIDINYLKIYLKKNTAKKHIRIVAVAVAGTVKKENSTLFATSVVRTLRTWQTVRLVMSLPLLFYSQVIYLGVRSIRK